MTRDEFINGSDLWVRFKGRRYYLPKYAGANNSPLCTKTQYEKGLCSFGHVYANYDEGNISRFGNNIGSLKDLELLDVQLPPVKPDFSVCLENALRWGSKL